MTALAGGYDCEFVKQSESDSGSFQCPICLLALRDPHLLSCCGVRICAVCIGKVKEVNKPCPICNQIFTSLLDKWFQRKVLEEKVWCSRRSAQGGCQWQGELRHLEKHEVDDCDFAKDRCECGLSLQRRLLPKHKTEECGLAVVKCDCGMNIQRDQLVIHKTEECEWTVVECECGISVQRRQLLEHQSEKCILKLLDKKLKSFTMNVKKMNERAAAVRTEMKKQCKEQMAAVKEMHAEQMATVRTEMKEMHEDEMAAVRTEMIKMHENEMVAVRTEMKKKCKEQMAAVKQMHAEQMAAVRTEMKEMHENEMAAVRTEMKEMHENEMAAVRTEMKEMHEDEMTAVRTGMKKQFEKEIATVRNEMKKMKEGWKSLFQRQIKKMDNLDGNLDAIGSHLLIQVPNKLHMPDYSFHKTNDVIWYSTPFYTESCGYKMCLCVANNYEFDCISVSIHLLQGEHDDQLIWPFRGNVSISLVNEGSWGNYSKNILFDAKSGSCAGRVRPNELGKGWGIEKFISHKDVESNTYTKCLLVDDSLEFSVRTKVYWD